MYTVAPASPSCSAMPLPIPRDAPVTNATCPFNITVESMEYDETSANKALLRRTDVTVKMLMKLRYAYMYIGIIISK